jgi:hypothetical protein
MLRDEFFSRLNLFHEASGKGKIVHMLSKAPSQEGV